MTMGELIKTLQRPAEGRLLAGVCAGAARSLNADVSLLRLAMLVLVLASGAGLLLYLLLWLLLPAEGQSRERGQYIVWSNMRGLRGELYQASKRLNQMWSDGRRSPWPVPLDRRWFAVGLITLGAAVLLISLGFFSWIGPTRAIGISAMAVGAAVLITLAPDLRR